MEAAMPTSPQGSGNGAHVHDGSENEFANSVAHRNFKNKLPPV